MKHYNVVVEYHNDARRQEMFENLNQVYGFLCGVLPSYRGRFRQFKLFKKWFIALSKRMKEPTLSLSNGQFTIK